MSNRFATQPGQIKKGHSVPAHVFTEGSERVYGAGSFQGKNYTDIKDVIHNTHFKETLVEKVRDGIVDDMVERQ